MFINRASVVYVIVLVCMVVGMWLILTFGSVMSAPEDISGDWTLKPLFFGKDRTLTVSQSGKFVNVRTDSGSVINLKITKIKPIESPTGEKLLIRLSGEKCDAELEGAAGSDAFRFRLKGFGYDGNWSAERTTRQFPAAHKRAVKPAS